MMNLREKILSAKDWRVQPVEVPEWGGTFYLRSLTGSERERYYVALVTAGEDLAARAKALRLLLLFALCDETGARIFSDEDEDALYAKDGDILERLRTEAYRFSGLGPQGVEDREKKSGNPQT